MQLTLQRGIILTSDPALIGTLMMSGHILHHVHDISALLRDITLSSPDGVIIDCQNMAISQSELLHVIGSSSCRIWIRTDTPLTLTDEQSRQVSISPQSTTITDMVSSISMKKTETTGIPMSHSRTVLIIEDNRDIREMYVLSFRSRGYSVHEASDGLAGIAQAAEIRPGVIILDIMMPHMDGFEVLHTLKHNTSIHPIIIVNSNLEGVDEERKVKELGADHFLRKSQYTPLEVVDFIEKEIFRIA